MREHGGSEMINNFIEEIQIEDIPLLGRRYIWYKCT